MSKADEAFIRMCKDILENGTSTEDEAVRPHWPDGTPAYTLKKFGVVNRYDLRQEFPALTLRKIGLKSAMDEILWIYQEKSNNIHDLNSHIWDEWADKNGSIGAAYGYQMAKKNRVKGITEEGIMKAFPGYEKVIIEDDGWRNIYYLPAGATEESKKIAIQETSCMEDQNAREDYEFKNRAYVIKQEDLYVEGGDGEGTTWLMDQINHVIYQLKNTPFSRRIMTMMWNPADAVDMALEPCAYSMTFNVTDDGGEKLVLNTILNQRSQDILAANGWNVAQYALLAMMIAQVCNMVPGEFVHVIADAHIYDRHVSMIRELINRTPQPAPKVWLDPDVKDFYDFTTDNLHIENYEVGGPQIKDIPIAV